LRCPYCGTADSVVKDSRPAEEDAAVRRRRGCNNCGGRFTTFERVQLRDLATGVVKSLDAGKAFFRRLAWSDTAASLAYLKGTADSAGTDTTWTASGVSRVGAPTQRAVSVGAGTTVALPDGMEVSPDRTPRWLEAQDALLIGLRVAAPPVPKAEQLEDDERPTLILWHHKDARLQSMQLVQECGSALGYGGHHLDT
jgi:hypothetical protein